MKKQRLAAGVLALAVSTALCGCEQAYKLTDAEKETIVSYSSHVVTKYNKRQPEGITDISAYERELAMKAAQQKEEQKQEEAKPEEQKPQQQTPEKTDNAGADGNTASGQEEVSYVSLNQAMQLGGVDAVYRTYSLATTYKETENYVVSANSGCELMIVYINLKNNSNKTAKCDILSKMPSFNLTVNGDVTVPADTTILLNDFGTYQGKIKAGDTKKTVLLFQVKKGAIKKVKSMDLEVTIGGKSAVVQLVK